MTADNPTNAERVQAFGLAIFGPEWGAGLGRLTGINPRTMTRIKVAALDGKEYPAAAGALAALAEFAEGLHAQTRPFSRTVAPAALPAPPASVTSGGKRESEPASGANPEKPRQRPSKAPARPETADRSSKAAQPQESGVAASVPLAGTFTRGPMQKTGKGKR